MSVFVDDGRRRLGRMVMCHMMADTLEELHAMAERIGMRREWFQGDHYDVCQMRRAYAVGIGAVQISQREMVRLRRRLRGAVACVGFTARPTA